MVYTLQVMQLGPAVTALSLSPTMDLLATAHVNHVGIYLWANRPLYLGTQAFHQGGDSEELVDIRLPNVSDAVNKSPEDLDHAEEGGAVEDDQVRTDFGFFVSF